LPQQTQAQFGEEAEVSEAGVGATLQLENQQPTQQSFLE
jgi:hypothetical protein